MSTPILHPTFSPIGATPQPSLLALPNELLLQVATYLDNPSSPDIPLALLPLVRTSRRLHTLLTPLLHSHALQHPDRARTALFWCSALPHIPLLRKILEFGPAFDIRTLTGILLHSSPAPVSEATLRRILAAGPNLNVEVVNLGGRTSALTWSIGTCHNKLCSLLLEKGADVTYNLDSQGSKALHIATHRSNVPAVRLLLSHGAAVNDRWGFYARTPLHMAVLSHHEAADAVELVTELLKYGADVAARDLTGNTPLLLAATNGKEGVVKVLLDAGADVNERRGDVRNSPWIEECEKLRIMLGEFLREQQR